MHKIIVFQKRAGDVERRAFFDQLLADQRARLERVESIRRCNVSLEAAGEDTPFDAAIELWFDDAKSAQAAFEGRGDAAPVGEDRARVSRSERLDVIEHPFVDTGEPSRFKLMAALKRREDLTRADFKSWWLDRHGPQVVVFPELRRYQVNLVEHGADRFVDGVAEVGFGDLATLQRITSMPLVKNVQQDSQVHTQARYRMLAQEHPLR